MYLLDTQILLWYVEGNEKIKSKFIDLIKSPQDDSLNNCYVSIASMWEITIKIKLKKLEIKYTLNNFFKLVYQNFPILQIEDKHLIEMNNLAFKHKDPFDRMLMAQAVCEEFKLITVDKSILLHKFIKKI